MAGARADSAAQLDREVERRSRPLRCGWANRESSLEVFTTRIDTIYGVSALLLSPGHPELERLLKDAPGRAAIDAQLKTMRQASTKVADIATAEKEGFFTGQQR